jgi:hypothetical protein
MSTLLYLHGYNSSSQSKKALQTKQWFALHAPHIKFICPDLPPFAKSAVDMLSSIIEAHHPESVFVVGSSMGGFFASYLIEQYDLRGVLINPAVNPTRGLANWIGENTNYMSGEKWLFESHHIDEFRQFESKRITLKSNYLVLLQTGDDVLDYRDAQIHYAGAKIIIEQGGDHSFIDYDQHLAKIHQFLTAD